MNMTATSRHLLLLLALGIVQNQSSAFVPSTTKPSVSTWGVPQQQQQHTSSLVVAFSTENDEEAWNGQVASNTENGRIKGCTITRVGDSLTDWVIQVDGEEADLGKFSEAIYKKLMMDAKQQRFQGFRPGTIPPHIEPTYRAYAMDEVAREATLEAMEQNGMRPFESARDDFTFIDVSIPPLATKKKKKKKNKKKKSKKNKDGEVVPEVVAAAVEEEAVAEEVPQWRSFETMKEAIDAGWKPGQSFSFRAKNVKGQQLKEQGKVDPTTALGQRGSATLQDNIAEAARLAGGGNGN
mmetsp:Transcript_6580/g.9412  ORF Transcript_6580/g.9412 Transcript_6580/m.9412 type:complete len:295 (+) Transcript_6580:153-1037(+)